MGKAKTIGIAALGIMALFFVVVIIVPEVLQNDSLNISTDVYGTFEGSRITPPLAFVSGGSTIDALEITAEWVGVGEGVDWSTLVISGDFTILRLDYQGRDSDIITPGRLDFLYSGAAHQTGDLSFTVPLDTLLIGVAYSGLEASTNMYYWNIKIVWDISGLVEQDVSGAKTLTDSLQDHVIFTIFWEDGTFGLSGGIIK